MTDLCVEPGLKISVKGVVVTGGRQRVGFSHLDRPNREALVFRDFESVENCTLSASRMTRRTHPSKSKALSCHGRPHIGQPGLRGSSVRIRPDNSGRVVGNPSLTGLWKGCPLYARSSRQRFLLVVSRRTETVIGRFTNQGATTAIDRNSATRSGRGTRRTPFRPYADSEYRGIRGAGDAFCRRHTLSPVRVDLLTCRT
jgi:hypothetical protein